MAVRSQSGPPRAKLKDEAVLLPARDVVDFVGAGVTVTDDPVLGRTVVDIPGTAEQVVVGRRTVDAPYVVQDDDGIVDVRTGGNITLPSPSNGRSLTVRRLA